MTALSETRRTTLPTAAASTTPSAALRGLTARISARISASVEEILPFASVDSALERITTRFLAGRRVVLAEQTADAIAVRAWSAATSCKVACAARLDGLVEASRDADVVVLSSPVPSLADACGSGLRPTIAPRELLLLRSRAPRPLLVLDLLDEEYARTPLTQPALLLPGTVVLRGFGRAWREAGACAAARIAFAAGPAELVSELGASDIEPQLAAAVSADLDRPNIDRAVRAAAVLGEGNIDGE